MKPVSGTDPLCDHVLLLSLTDRLIPYSINFAVSGRIASVLPQSR